MVLAKLAGSIAQRLEHFCDRWVFRLKPDSGAGHSYFSQAGAKWVLPANESGSPCGAALLAVIIGTSDALFGDAINVRGAIAHHAAAEITDIPRADVIAP